MEIRQQARKMNDEMRNALRAEKAVAKAAQRFGDRSSFMVEITDPVIIQYHTDCIQADYDLSAAVLAGLNYSIGKSYLVGRYENTKKDREHFATSVERIGVEEANRIYSNQPILVTEVITDKAIGYATNRMSAYGIISAVQRTDGITYYGCKGFASRFKKKGNLVGDGRNIITTILGKSGNSKKPYRDSECRASIMAWMFGEYSSEVRNCVLPADATYLHEELKTPEGITLVWNYRSEAVSYFNTAAKEIIRAAEIAGGMQTPEQLVSTVMAKLEVIE